MSRGFARELEEGTRAAAPGGDAAVRRGYEFGCRSDS